MYSRRSYSRRPAYGRNPRPYGSRYSRGRYRPMAGRPAYGARAGFARRRMTRRFTVGGSRW